MTNKKEQVVGIIGGCGPWATVDIEMEIMDAWRSENNISKEQDFLSVLVYNYPKFHDRNYAIYNNGISPYKQYLDIARKMSLAGANIFAIACNTAHIYFDELIKESGFQFVNIVNGVVEHCINSFPKVNKIGILATRATCELNLYNKYFSCFGVNVIIPSLEQIEEIMKSIYLIKMKCERSHIYREEALLKATHKFVTQKAVEHLKPAIKELIENECDHIILGCTELPIILNDLRKNFPKLKFINPNKILAQSIVQHVKLLMR